MNYIKLYEPFFGSWQLEEELGQDRLGKVYKICKNDWNKKYESILKVISVTPNNINDPTQAKNGFDVFVNNIDHEIKSLSALNKNVLNYKDHSIVKRFDDAGYDILIRMDYLDSLYSYLLNNRLTKRDILRLGIDICQALEECHGAHILHKNITPNTIFLNRDGKFCLGNFSLSIDKATLLDNTTQNPNYFYMAPEVFNLGEFSESSDLYSLGIVLYKLLNDDKFPFLDNVDDDPKISLFKRLSSEDIPYPKHDHEGLSKIILKCISFDKSKRYSYATQMKNALCELLLNFKDENLFVTSTIKTHSGTVCVASGNNVNGNLIEYIDDDTYLVNLSDGQKIYKTNEKHNLYNKLSDEHASNIKYYKNFIYFINKSDNDKIYRMNCNGSCKNIILDEETTDMFFYNDWIYYTSYDNRISRIKPDGLDKTLISSDKCLHFSIYKDTIYYANELDNHSIYKFNINTKHKMKLSNTPSWFINIYKEQIFYANFERNKIYRMELDGSAKCVVANLGAKFINVYKDYIYFSNTNDYNNLYKVGIDSLNLQKLNNDYTEQINIVNDWIYYKNNSDNGALYRMKIDGTDRSKVLPLCKTDYLFL